MYQLILGFLLISMASFSWSESSIRPLSTFEHVKTRINLIRETRPGSDILISHYIFRLDDVGKVMLKELVAAAKRGVNVKILIDGIGEGLVLSYGNEEYHALEKLGIQFKIFNPKRITLHSLRKRMHHKIFLAGDNVILGSSGLYLQSFYNIVEADYLLKGEIVKDVSEHFNEFWNSDLAQAPLQEFYRPHESPNVLDEQYTVPKFLKNIETFAYTHVEQDLSSPDLPEISQFTTFPQIQYLKDKPVKDSNSDINRVLLDLIASAKESVTIVTPYPYFPQELKDHLRSLGGKVRVKVLTSSAKSKLDEHASLYAAFREQVPFFLESGIEVHESHNFLHSKLLLVDGKHVFIGSHNFDYLGFYDNNENGLLIRDIDSAPDFQSALNDLITTYEANGNVLVKQGELLGETFKCKGMMCGLWKLYYPKMAKELKR